MMFPTDAAITTRRSSLPVMLSTAIGLPCLQCSLLGSNRNLGPPLAQRTLPSIEVSVPRERASILEARRPCPLTTRKESTSIAHGGAGLGKLAARSWYGNPVTPPPRIDL